VNKPSRTEFPSDAGLTILELMIVLAILSMVGVVASFQVIGQMDRAKVDVARLQLRQIQSALTLFELDTRRYPSESEGLVALLTAPEGASGWRGPYIKSRDLLADPWGHGLRYSSDGDLYEVVSVGADGKNEGEGSAADIALRSDQ
jgi:general secretion pathway protein G